MGASSAIVRSKVLPLELTSETHFHGYQQSSFRSQPDTQLFLLQLAGFCCICSICCYLLRTLRCFLKFSVRPPQMMPVNLLSFILDWRLNTCQLPCSFISQQTIFFWSELSQITIRRNLLFLQLYLFPIFENSFVFSSKGKYVHTYVICVKPLLKNLIEVCIEL